MGRCNAGTMFIFLVLITSLSGCFEIGKEINGPSTVIIYDGQLISCDGWQDNKWQKNGVIVSGWENGEQGCKGQDSSSTYKPGIEGWPDVGDVFSYHDGDHTLCSVTITQEHLDMMEADCSAP